MEDIYTVCSHGARFAGYIPTECMHVVCNQGGEFFH